MTQQKKMRQYIDKMKQQYRSPIELWKEVEVRWGTITIPPSSGKDLNLWLQIDSEEDDYTAAKRIYNEAIYWASWNDMAVQDYLAESCGVHRVKSDNHQEYVNCVKLAIEEMANHLKKGQDLGLSELEQRVVDTLWGWVPHNYWENYVNCAREVSETIVHLLPPETEERSEEGYRVYLDAVITEVKKLAEKHDVEFDTTKYNLTTGYLCEWLATEYGLVFDDTWDEEFEQ